MFMNEAVAKARWVWPVQYSDAVNQYIRFRHVFNLESWNGKPVLSISCEGNFSVFLNGHFIATGQFSDFPDKPTCTTVEVGEYLLEGDNELNILGYHFGIDHFSHIPAAASLLYALDCGNKVIASGGDTEYQLDPAYRSGEIARLTPQMGFVFEYDARKTAGNWQKIQSGDLIDRPIPEPRPLPLPELKPQTSMTVIAKGSFIRSGEVDGKTVGQLMQSDFLSPEDGAGGGSFIIVDMGREECGFITFEVEAPVGTVLDIAVGQHLAQMRVGARIGSRNFASLYICGEGRQTFTHYNNRYSGRYIQINASSGSEQMKIHYAGLIPFEYPIAFAGKFNGEDSLLNKIYEVCGRTLHLCMHEHYEDTPWREQGLYANDGRNQALTGYYVFGEYEFPKVSLELLGQGMRPNNFIPLTAPSNAADFVIPSFTFAWIAAVRDYLMYSGDKTFVETQMPQVRLILDSLTATCENDLLPCPKGKGYWHFYDWADGLDGVDNGNFCFAWTEIKNNRFDAPLNLFYISALEAASDICCFCGEVQAAEDYRLQAAKTKQAFDKAFWCESEQAYQTYLGEQSIPGHFCELVQALAVLSGTGRKELLDRLIQPENGMVATTLSQSLYKYQALFSGGGKYAQWVFDDMLDQWGYMLNNGATSFWETIKGAADFDGAGSLCHGWSAIPAYFCHSALLGITPLEPGFKKFTVAPVSGILNNVSGEVMTPDGPVSISISGKNIRIRHPRTIIPVYDEQSSVYNICSEEF